MFVPRIFIIAGIALIAIALGASGHGLWWLIPFVWFVGGRRHGWYACGSRHHRGDQYRYGDDDVHEGGAHTPDSVPADPPAGAPDPSRDRHEAFPTGR